MVNKMGSTGFTGFLMKVENDIHAFQTKGKRGVMQAGWVTLHYHREHTPLPDQKERFEIVEFPPVLR
jgi:hypothetical protein